MRQWYRSFGGAGEVLVLVECVSWLANPKAYDAAYSRLPYFRQEKADLLAFERDRWLSVGVWLLLEQAFCIEGFCLSDYPIEYSEQGKPYAWGCPLRFSVSHSGKYAMCAVSRIGEIGCDIQQTDAYDAGLARACMIPSEFRDIEALSSAAQRAHAFCRHWVVKESYMKALGYGLAKDPASISVEFCDGGKSDSFGSAHIFDDTFVGRTEAFEVCAPKDYCAAVCVLDCLG